MQIITAPQGSDAWYSARAGVITGSNFKLRHKAKTGANKGGWTETARSYAFKTALERISGKPLDEGIETYWMKRGHELEPVARRKHEAKLGIIVDEVGFVTDDEKKFGVSADGWIDQDGGAEYKCFVDPAKLRPILLEGDISDVVDQCQGGMWVTGRTYWDFVLYCPALEAVGQDLNIIRINRDDDYINEMEIDLIALERLVSEYEAQIRSRKAACPEIAAAI